MDSTSSYFAKLKAHVASLLSTWSGISETTISPLLTEPYSADSHVSLCLNKLFSQLGGKLATHAQSWHTKVRIYFKGAKPCLTLLCCLNLVCP